MKLGKRDGIDEDGNKIGALLGVKLVFGELGPSEGVDDGTTLGTPLGSSVGVYHGTTFGTLLGVKLGLKLGKSDGIHDGTMFRSLLESGLVLHSVRMKV